jgi:glycosyltransferase involved in cell wall biosynthesis
MSATPAGKKPRISVLIPACNAGRYIDASLDSALRQSEPDLEVIAVINGSSDDTEERLRRCADPRLRVIAQPAGGLAAALNTAILAARADYIAFLDADDIWRPEKLARHLEAHHRRPEIDATFSWVRVIDARGCILRMPCPRWRGSANFSSLLSDYTIRTMSAVVMKRTSALEAGLLDPALTRCVDIDFLLRVALLRPNNILAVPRVLNLYRRHSAQRTSEWSRILEGWNQLLGKMRTLAPAQTASVERLASSNMYRYFAFLAYVGGDFRQATELAARSLAASPGRFFLDARNWKMGAAVLASRIMPRAALAALEYCAGFQRAGNQPVPDLSWPRDDSPSKPHTELNRVVLPQKLG